MEKRPRARCGEHEGKLASNVFFALSDSVDVIGSGSWSWRLFGTVPSFSRKKKKPKGGKDGMKKKKRRSPLDSGVN